MCVIAYKPLGVKVFTKDVLEKCWNANDDGAGFAWFDPQDGLWHVRKGFLSFKKFWKAYKAQQFTENNTVICHFRIGTAGLKDAGNTHPFPVTDDMELMRQTEFAVESIVFHNGVVGSGEDKFSDTMVHVRDYISPIIDKLGVNPKIPGIYNEILGKGSSKWIITKGDHLWKFGHTWVNEEEWLFSNSNWKYKTTYVSHSAGTGFTGNYSAGAQKNKNWRGYNQGYANEYGRYVNGVWTQWTDTEMTGQDYKNAVKNNDGTVDFTSAAKKKKKDKKKVDAKEDHSRTDTIFAVAGDDGTVQFSEKSNKFFNLYGMGYLVCPCCYEEKRLDDSPYDQGDTLCQDCGAVFYSKTGEIVMYDLETRRKVAGKSYGAILSTPVGMKHLTPEDRQKIIDAQTDELCAFGYY